VSITFTKLFTSITESTIWREDDATRLMWITMLAMADSRGRVFASVPGLADRARVPVDRARIALGKFLAPDPDSRTPDHEGRRIEAIDGGWRLLNHAKYRELRDEEAIKESKRKYINARRAKEREAKAHGVEQSDVVAHGTATVFKKGEKSSKNEFATPSKSLGANAVPHHVEKVERGRHNAEADSDAESDAFERKNERTHSAESVSQSSNASEAIGIGIPKALRIEPAFMESWNSYCQHVLEAKPRAEAVTLLKRQLGLCAKWATDYGVENVVEKLDQALNHSGTFIVDEDYVPPSEDDIPF
jgi:hypothetical protein